MGVKPIDLIEVERLIEKAWKEVDERIEEIEDLKRNLVKLVKEDKCFDTMLK